MKTACQLHSFCVFYYSPSIKDWRFDKVAATKSSIRYWVRRYAKIGYLYPYEVEV